MTTVLVRSADGHADPAVRGWGDAPADAPHVHFRTDDLAKFLTTIRIKATP
jgi:hypothetical protein